MKITHNIPKYIFEAGAVSALNELLKDRRKELNGVFDLIFVDEYFKNNTELIPDFESNFEVVYVSTATEPTCAGINEIAERFRAKGDLPTTIVGMGGGCTLDTAKAVSILLTNPGQAEDYQGWDLVKNPGIYKIGIPTISGTGAEASRTCVLTNYEKNLKLGFNSEHTLYDFLILDPNLTKTVDRNQYFYTGMDTYIHCIESLNGSHRHALSDAYSREALRLCEKVFSSDDMMTDENRHDLMVASFLGGTAIANSFVGVVHPLSAGLSMTYGTHHCIGNCIIMDQMSDYYPEETISFKKYVSHQGVELPRGLTDSATEEHFESLYKSSVIHEKPLENALGKNFKEILSFEKVKKIFETM